MPPRPFRLTPPRLSENDVEAQCKTVLALHSYLVIRLHAGVYQTLDGKRHIHGVPKGTPDYACLHKYHRNFLLEVKRPGGELSDDQKVQIAEIQRQYGLPIVVVEHVEQLGNFLARHEHPP
jgi:sulfite reductase beta subunit-like hemoprotein